MSDLRMWGKADVGVDNRGLNWYSTCMHVVHAYRGSRVPGTWYSPMRDSATIASLRECLRVLAPAPGRASRAAIYGHMHVQ